jgi:hypothetical protein
MLTIREEIMIFREGGYGGPCGVVEMPVFWDVIPHAAQFPLG